MKKLTLVAVLVLSATLPSFAQSRDISLWVSQPFVTSSNSIEGISESLTLDENIGFGIGERVALTPRWSLSADVFRITSDASLTTEDGDFFADLGELTLTPVSLMAQFHPFRASRRADVWIGAGLASVLASDLESDDLDALGIGRVRVDDEIAPVAAAGLDIPISPKLVLALEARYMPLELNGKIEGDASKTPITVDPLMASVGLRYRF